jgi:hypothetical protein
MTKTDINTRLQQNKDKLSQGNQQSTQEHPERWNPAKKSMEMLLDKVNQNIQVALMKF